MPAIFQHVSGYLDELEAGLLARGLCSLRPRDAARRSGILSFEPPAGLTADSAVLALADPRDRLGKRPTIFRLRLAA